MMGVAAARKLRAAGSMAATWNINSKIAAQGQLTWSNAQFTNQIAGTMRDLSGNGLPINHTTGNFPIQQGDPAFNYDRNPNSISPQTLHDSLPLNPVYSDDAQLHGRRGRHHADGRSTLQRL